MKNIALITGASSGIGLEFARVFAEHGHNLVLVARRKEKLDALAEALRAQHQISVIVEVHDLSNSESCHALFESMSVQNIRIDYLVNNAGLGFFGRFDQVEWDKQQQMLNVNIMALTHLSRLFIPAMVNAGTGHIINVASTASFQPGPTFAVYCATKAYVLSFSEAIAEELGNTGVGVTALCPGLTESGFFEVADISGSQTLQKMKLPTSRDVADYGYLAMTKKRKVAIHGLANWMVANSNRFFPRAMVAWVSRMYLQRIH